jgi:hypothetical protein
MYDTINMWLSRDLVVNTDLLATIPYHLTQITNEGYNTRTEQHYISGNLGNYKVGISENGLSLKGSLAKFYLDDNLQILTRQDSQRAIELMSDVLHLPIQKAKVNRLDIGYNIKTKYPTESYYNFLGDAQYYKRLMQPKSIYYQNNSRQLIFYNKIAESKSKGVAIPPIYQGANLLRYELRFMRGVSKQLKEEVTAKTIYNEDFYIKAIDKWHSNYQSIKKIHILNLDHQNMNSPKDFFSQLIATQLHQMGLNEALQLVEDLRSKKTFKKAEYYSRIKRDIKKYFSNPQQTEEPEQITELNTKLDRAVKNYR